MATYTYFVTDFFKNSVFTPRFKQEISDDPAIVPNLLAVYRTIESVYIEFDLVLDAGGITALDTLVAAHDGTDLDVRGIDPSLLVEYDRSFSPEGLERTEFLETVSVGRPGFPSPLYVGEGPPEAYSMTVLTQTDVPGESGLFLDVTGNLLMTSGATQSMFPNTTINNGVFIGSDQPFGGMHFLMNSGGDHGIDELTVEYYAGSWQTLQHMSTAAQGFPQQYGNDLWTRNSDIEHVRFGPTPDWETTSINGVTKYWIRAYLNTGVGNVPSLEWLRLHTNSASIGPFGALEYFGDTRLAQLRPLPWDQRLQLSVPGQSPGSGSINYSANISSSGSGNRFAQGAQDAFAGTVELPPGIDTSQPLYFVIKWLPVAAGAGDVEFTFRYTTLRTGDAVDGTAVDNEDTTLVSVVLADQNLLQETVLVAEIPTAQPSDLLVFNIERDARPSNLSDTYEANVDVVSHLISGFFWR